MSDKNFEEKLKKHWREEADSIPVPDSLHPAKIEEMVEKAVKGMLPHNRLGRAMYKKLFVYRGENHPHMAQKPEEMDI